MKFLLNNLVHGTIKVSLSKAVVIIIIIIIIMTTTTTTTTTTTIITVQSDPVN